MATKPNKDKEKKSEVIRARVEPALQIRLTNYRTKKGVERSEAYVVREAVIEFLDKHE